MSGLTAASYRIEEAARALAAAVSRRAGGAVGAPTTRIVVGNLGRYSGLLETTQLVLGGLDAGNWVCVSMDFLPLAVLAPEDQRDPKRYRGWCLTTDRCLRMLRADNVTQIGTNAGSADV